MEQTSHAPQLCTKFQNASELIGRRWTGAILFLLLKQKMRFAMLRDAIPDITDRMLTDRLQELEREGLVDRTVIPATPVRVEYSLTQKGTALTDAMNAIANWAEKWMELPPAAEKPAEKPDARKRA